MTIAGTIRKTANGTIRGAIGLGLNNFTPADPGGLAAWYKADAGITKTDSKVTAWADQTDNGYDATGVASPIIGQRLVKGRDAVEFTGHGYFTLPTGFRSLLSKDNDFTVAVTFKVDDTSVSGIQILHADTGANDRFAISYVSGQIRTGLFVGTHDSFAADVSDTDMHVLVVTNDSGGDGVTAYFDGVEMTITANANYFNNSTATIGSRAGNQDEWQGLIGEIAVYDKVLSAAERGNLETYLTNRWDGAETQVAKHAALRHSWPVRAVETTHDSINARIKVRSPKNRAIKGLRAAFPNVIIEGSPNAEVATGNSIDVAFAVEYDSTITAATFAGVSLTTIADGAIGRTDLIEVEIPADTEFYIRVHAALTTTGRIPMSRPCISGSGDAVEAGTGLTDKSASGTITHGGNRDAYMPSELTAVSDDGAILAVELEGDSNIYGFKDGTVRANGQRGMESLLFEQGIPYTNTARNGAAAQAITGERALRNAQEKYRTHNIMMLGTNDLRAGRTPAQIETDLETIIGNNNNPTYLLTIPPDESDGFGTATSNDADFTAAERTTLNDAIRNGDIAGAAGHFDVGDLLESTTNSNIWGDTDWADADGYHISTDGYDYLGDQLGATVADAIGWPTVSTPLSISLTNLSLDDPGSGDTVGTLSGTDSFGKALTFTIQTNPSSLFEITGGTTLKLTNVAEPSNGTYTVTIRATNTDSNTLDVDFDIVVTNSSFAPSLPSVTGMVVQYDSSETGTLTTSGSTVTTWGDNSANSNDATGSNTPTTGSSLNGENAIDFVQADSDYFTSTAAVRDALSELTDFTVFVAYKRDDTTDTFLVCAAKSGSDRMAIHLNTVIRCGTYDGTTFSSVSVADTETTNPHIISMENNSGVVSAWIDGTAMGGTATPVTTGVAGAWIGSRNGANTFDGLLGEVLIYDNAVSLSDREAIEGYLATKWGATLA